MILDCSIPNGVTGREPKRPEVDGPPAVGLV
jgi:hypothetical protein